MSQVSNSGGAQITPTTTAPPVVVITRATPRTGGYAVSTEESHPWLSTPIKPTASSKQRKSKAPPPIVNAIFAECIKLTTDPFWARLFTQASLGKFPRKFSYRNKLLTYKRGTKVQTVEIPQMPPEAFSAATAFFRKFGGMVSEMDQEASRLDQYYRSEQAQNNPVNSWSGISKKIRSVLLENFIQEMKQQFKLSVADVTGLRYVINVGIILGSFSKENIIVSDGKIVEIQGLELKDPEKKIFHIAPQYVAKTVKIKPLQNSHLPCDPPLFRSKDEDISYFREWIKLLESLDKKANKSMEPGLRIILSGGVNPGIASAFPGSTVLSSGGGTLVANTTVPTGTSVDIPGTTESDLN